MEIKTDDEQVKEFESLKTAIAYALWVTRKQDFPLLKHDDVEAAFICGALEVFKYLERVFKEQNEN
jgi:hypothetical protein